MSFEIHFCHEDTWPEYVDVKISSEREVRTYVPERTCRLRITTVGWGCSACHVVSWTTERKPKPNYCPNCGAKVVSE